MAFTTYQGQLCLPSPDPSPLIDCPPGVILKVRQEWKTKSLYSLVLICRRKKQNQTRMTLKVELTIRLGRIRLVRCHCHNRQIGSCTQQQQKSKLQEDQSYPPPPPKPSDAKLHGDDRVSFQTLPSSPRCYRLHLRHGCAAQRHRPIWPGYPLQNYSSTTPNHDGKTTTTFPCCI